MNPKNCLVNTRYTASSPACPATVDSINKMNSIFASIDYAHSSESTKGNSIRNQATSVKSAYTTFLIDASIALNGYTTRFRPFSVIYNDYIGNGSILSVINCAFIGKNVKVMLYYLNDSIGKGFMALGSILIFIGFIMLANIAFTILLLSIINEVARIRSMEKEMAAKTNANEAYEPDIIPSGNVIIPASNNIKN